MRRCLLVITLAVAAVAAACGDNRNNQTPDAGTPPPDTGEPGPGPGEIDPPPVTKACEKLTPTANTCEVTAGSKSILLKGNVLTPGTVYTGGQVLVDATGQIACVGCDCAAGDETVITCADASISPGLINTHDHITFDQNPPFHDVGERYEDRHQWRIPKDGHTEIPAPGNTSRDLVRWAELRFLMGGATSIVGSGGEAGLLRNLDKANLQEGLGKPAVVFDTFPLDDNDGVRNTTTCDYGNNATTGFEIANANAYEPHTSEGIDATAHNEFLCQSSMSYDVAPPLLSQNLLRPQTAMIHAIGLTASDYAAMAAAGTGMIWSPRSNIVLYGDTARVTEAWRAGVHVALGTDWLPSGSSNLLRELTCADSFNQTYLHKFFRDDQLWKMVTSNAALITHTDDKIGTLAQGKVADISIFAGHGKAPFRAVLDAQSQDIALVLRAGKPLYGDAAVLTALAAPTCDTVDVCGASKQVCLATEFTAATDPKTFAAMQSAAAAKGPGGTIYPAFSCETPKDEPSCAPMRPTSVDSSTIYTGEVSSTDGDGDGIADTSDNCPNVFNPIRPMDNGVQPDSDGDGQGDACDVCPLDSKSNVCGNVDRDADGVPDKTDNCPSVANKDQNDSDKDGTGDACDVCPDDANPGFTGCPTTIYKINSGATAPGIGAKISNALVTAIPSNTDTTGFFVQIKEGDAGYIGADNSGLFIFAKAPTGLKVGNRVTVSGVVQNFFTELEISGTVTVTVTSTDVEAPPAPIKVKLADIKTGGPRTLALDGVIVQVDETGTVSAGKLPADFTLGNGTDSVLVDTFLSQFAKPAVGSQLTSVTGVLALRGEKVGTVTTTEAKIEPRSSADLPAAIPALVSLTPATSTVRVGNDAMLTVTLSGPAQGPTTVHVTSADTATLSIPVTDVVVADGQTTATATVHGVAVSAGVVVTATLGAVSKTATVQVLDAAQAPTILTLTTDTTTIVTGGVAHLTASLDLPALADTAVTLAISPADAGTLSATTITIGAGQTTATATFTDAATSGTVTITASATGFTDFSVMLAASGVSALDHLVISQVYGGGGGAGATLAFDFIEIHNPTNAPISLAGMSVQYAAAGGANFSNFTVLPNTAIVPAGGYYLVGESGSTMDTLPKADVLGAISMAQAAGKVALVTGTTQLPGNGCPMTAAIIDYVGYGTTATCFEGHPTGNTSTTTSAQRKTNGCTDTNDNLADFTIATPAPRNSASTIATCQ